MATFSWGDSYTLMGYMDVGTPAGITASGNTVTLPLPTLKMKWSDGYSTASDTQQMGLGCSRSGSSWYDETAPAFYYGSTYIGDARARITSLIKKNTYANGTWYKYSNTVNTSSLFNANNKTSKTAQVVLRAPVNCIFTGITSTSTSYAYNTYAYNNSVKNLATYTVTLNAPPTFTNDSITFDTQGAFAKVTTASVHVDNITAYYGGYIKEAKLTIGNQSAILTGDATNILDEGTLSIQLDTVGTFTPVLTVTDSRGQVKTVSLSSITVTAGDDTAFDSTQVSADTPDFYAEATTASVTVSNIVVPYGGSVASTKLVIGNQEIPGSGAGTLQIALDTVGTFTPVVSVTDSWGRTFSETLNDITVKEYFAPGISLDVDRAASDGTIDEESTTHILVTMPFTYTRDVATFAKPTLKVGLQEQNVTWYESWDSVNGVSDPISSWTNYHPSSPDTIYALVPGTFALANTYDVYVTAHDSNGKNSEEMSQKVSTAFFTMDFLAGGHGVAIGKLATEDDLFECDLDAQFNKDVYVGGNMHVAAMIGSVQMFAGQTAPDGWLLCYGQAVSREDYANLFTVIGTTYGAGDGSTTFNLPDMRDRFPVGAGSSYNLNSTGGANDVTLNTTQIPAHTHGRKSLSGTMSFGNVGDATVGASGICSHAGGANSGYTGNSANSRARAVFTVNAAHEHTSVGGGQAHENRPPYLGINFIIYAGA